MERTRKRLKSEANAAQMALKTKSLQEGPAETIVAKNMGSVEQTGELLDKMEAAVRAVGTNDGEPQFGRDDVALCSEKEKTAKCIDIETDSRDANKKKRKRCKDVDGGKRSKEKEGGGGYVRTMNFYLVDTK
ncbi:hypothetical protein MVEN_02387900 [Mycena venus]|uniref:Uncharacterized protein n=1 Tax=Mycena venus TaxID=2733690 RepID=A0A8H7CDR3_9AGAR|nr:hypothetical protein MVEN_02387900 [Mycena venus]